MSVTSRSSDPRFPRPDFVRDAPWLLLDGTWDFFPDGDGALKAPAVLTATAPETIAVPGPWETSASGGRHDWLEIAWYRHVLDLPSQWPDDRRTVIHFEAVFHACELWIGTSKVLSHEGGYLPFEADITDALAVEPPVLLLRVVAPSNKLDIPHGKQRSIPFDDYNGCCFTPTSGVWQSVWIEPRPYTHIARIDVTPASTLDAIDVAVHVAGPEADSATVELRLTDGTSIQTTADERVGRARIDVTDPQPWSPENPHLYEVTAVLGSSVGSDTVSTYTGMRRIETRDGGIYLNGERIYVRGVLDQGYWEHSGLTAPSSDALLRDLQLAKACGFNLVRKHLKAEDPRWLHHADTLGMLVWSEPASTGRFSEAGVAAFEAELSGLITRDRNHPSVIIWSAYNEEWGLDWDLEADALRREAAERAYRLIRELDPTRLAIDNSGWTHVATDLLDWHYYSENPHTFHHTIAGLLTGERPQFEVFHSADYPIPKGLGAAGFHRDAQPIINSEYGGGWNSLDRAWHTRWQTQFLRAQPNNQGYVYTELYDIEHETVGIFTFGRGSKDQNTFEQSDVHTVTVIAPLIAPVTVGADLVVEGGSALTVPVVLSHHGATRLDANLRWTLRDGMTGAQRVIVHPFTPTDPVDVTVPLPRGYQREQLRLALISNGSMVAQTFIDLAEHEPPSHLPPDQGWRAPQPRADWNPRNDLP